VLTALGGTDAEDVVYRELIAAASVTAAELTRTLGLPEDVVMSALTTLEAQGLASRTVTRPPRFVASPPDIAVDALLLRRQAELSDARAELGELVKIYRSGRRTRSIDELIEVVSGAEALAERVGHLQRAARVSFDGFVKPPFVAIDVDEAESLSRPEISYRALYDKEITSYPTFLSKLRQNSAPHAEYRLHSALPMKLIIADRDTALLPLERDISDAAPAAVIVHSCGLLDALIALFEQYWDAGLSLQFADDPPPGAMNGPDRRILSLLVGGVTDEAIARQVGVSLRTVRRRIQEMMLAANARNRAQLAWHAARNSWLA
jgi:sugar-specific transcriptional regulator TrmB/DNA-binding CsgD family transcriptional regulator